MKKELHNSTRCCKLIYKGIKVTVEESADRIISTEEYHKLDVK